MASKMMPKEKDKKQPKLNLEYNANFQKFIFDKLGNDACIVCADAGVKLC